MKARILIIDDDVSLTQLLSEYLSQNELDSEAIHAPLDAIEHLRTHEYQLILLDVMMPQIDGFETLKRLRHITDTPVIMLTAKGDSYDKVLGLELGADDYLAKPFNHRELLARIKANTRRFTQGSTLQRQSLITLSKVSLDSSNQSAYVNEIAIDFTSTEFQLLYVLMKNAGNLLTKDKLNETVLGRKLAPFDRSLDMHISNIRKKLAELKVEDVIKTIRGSGYLFVDSEI